MSKFIQSATSAHAWADVVDHLLDSHGGKAFNVVTAIQEPCVEISEVTRVIDELARSLRLKGTMENANAIWPSFFARPGRKSQDVFSDIERFAVPAIKAACNNKHDSYIERLIAWRGRETGTPVPQLQNVLARLKTEATNPGPKSSTYEISIYSPGLDAGYMGFPCLSHLSFKYDHPQRALHLTALYRNHYYLSHAYGNFIGLGRLMRFVSGELGIFPGELVSISTHADAELGGRKSQMRSAIARVRNILDGGDSNESTPGCGAQPVSRQPRR